MVYNREEAAKRAEASTTNTYGLCQLWTRTQYGAPSVGDQDGDGDADAVDGWKSEPLSERHTDRNPPRGVPVSWSGGSRGFGHRAISLGNGKIRSTDAGGAGKVATVSLDWPEKTWGMRYLGWSDTISGIVIPLPPPPPPPPPTEKTVKLKFAHVSLEFSDTNRQHTEDITKIFSRGYDVITGTEARVGEGNTADELKRIGTEKGYRVHVTSRYDTWVAVKKSIIAGNYTTGAEFAISKSSSYTPKPPGVWGDRGVVWTTWDMTGYGTFTVGAVHYLTAGGAGATLKVKTDTHYAKVIQAWADVKGKGSRLVFVGGDFNLVDAKNDIFKGVADFKSCWDDLKKWPDTGHGNIDAIARYKPDQRVKCVAARVLNDEAVFLHGDHFLVVAEYEISA